MFSSRAAACLRRLPSFVGSAYRECLENGTWASRINYSQCVPILDDKVSSQPPLALTLVPVRYQGSGQARSHREATPVLCLLGTLLCTLFPCPMTCSVLSATVVEQGSWVLLRPRRPLSLWNWIPCCPPCRPPPL